jgi:hypothetical protein
MYGFGEATFFILLDASAGYHQVQLSESSMMKTAFFALHGRKYCWVVMPFGLKNAPPVYVAMMHDLKELWTEMAEANGIDTTVCNDTTIIIDDNFIYGVSIDNAFLMTRCVCLIARKYHLTWKLKKSQWLPSKVEFVGVDIHRKGGNSPAQSKDIILTNWNVPTTPYSNPSIVWQHSAKLKICRSFRDIISTWIRKRTPSKASKNSKYTSK